MGGANGTVRIEAFQAAENGDLAPYRGREPYSFAAEVMRCADGRVTLAVLPGAVAWRLAATIEGVRAVRITDGTRKGEYFTPGGWKGSAGCPTVFFHFAPFRTEE